TTTLATAVSSGLQLILVLATMFYFSWQVTLIALVLIPLFIFPARRIGASLQRLVRESMQLNAQMGTTMTERFNVAGAMLSKQRRRPRRKLRLFAPIGHKVRDR